MTRPHHQKPLEIVTLSRGGETFALVYDAEHRADALRTLGRWASDPELAFSWFDAARMASRIRMETHA